MANDLRKLRDMIPQLRDTYKSGTIVELLKMDDRGAPPIGTRGVVDYVDDIGNIHIRWDNGSGLAVIPGVDEIKIVKQ